MKIDITMQQDCSDKLTAQQVARRARKALNRFDRFIQTLAIRITDTNGPKGGVDIRCILSLKLIITGEIIVQGGGENVVSALNRCLSRAERTISRSLERRRNTPIRMNRRWMTFEDEGF